MPPQETLFLESTTRIQKDSMHSFMDFQIWDIPGQFDYFSPNTPGTPLSPSNPSDPSSAAPPFDTESVFSTLGALVWVIDAQDELSPSLMRLINTILHLQVTHPKVNIEVLVHKTDGVSDEYKSDAFHAISQRIEDELADAGYGLGGDEDQMPRIHYHLTSIYDYSIFEAFSRIIQRLIPQLGTLENLLNILVNNTGMEKAYLFDVLSKIYVASDTRPGGSEMYELGSDFVDVVVDTSELYSYARDEPITPTSPSTDTRAEMQMERRRRVVGSQCTEAESHCLIQDGGMTYMVEMNEYLCLVAVFRNPEAKHRKGLIDYNCHVFQEGLNGVFERGWEAGEDDGVEAAQQNRKARNAAAVTAAEAEADREDEEA